MTAFGPVSAALLASSTDQRGGECLPSCEALGAGSGGGGGGGGFACFVSG